MSFLDKFRDWEDVEEHRSQAVIFPAGSPADVLYVIISGEVELTLRGEQLGTEGVGGIIGEMAIPRSATRTATATALTDVKLARLNRDQLSELMSESNEFSLHVMTVLANRLRAVDAYITTQFERHE